MAGNIVTAAATLLGVGMTLFFTTSMRRQDRLDARLDKERESLVEVLAVGRDWVASLQGLLIGAAIQPDIVAFTSSWSFEQFGPLNKQLPRALLAARLLVTDQEISRHLVVLGEALPELSQSAGLVQNSAQKNRGRADREVYDTATAGVDAFGKALENLEGLARRRLLSTTSPVGGRLERLAQFARRNRDL